MYIMKSRMGWLVMLMLVAMLAGCQSNQEDSQTTQSKMQESGQPDSPAPKLTDVAWSHKLGTEQSDGVRSVILDKNVLYASSRYGHVAAINSGTGETYWDYSLNSDGGSADAAYCLSKNGSKLYVGSVLALQALDEQTGKPVWKVSVTDGDADNWVVGCPVVRDNRVYFGTWGGALYAVDDTTGAVLWKTSIPNHYSILTTPVFLNEEEFVFYSSDGNLYQMNIKTTKGEILLETALSGNRYEDNPIGSGDGFTPVLDQGILYFGSWDGNVYAYDTSAKRELWRFNSEGPVRRSPILAGDRIIVSSSAGLYALQKNSGKVVWKSGGNGNRSTAFYQEGLLYEGLWKEQNSTLRAVDASSGEEKWSLNAADEFIDPIAADGRIYFGSYDGYVYAKELNKP